MFPTPATRSCDSRNAFTGALRPDAMPRSASAVKSGASGSSPARPREPAWTAAAPAEVVVHGVVAEQHDARTEAPGVGEDHMPAVVQVDLHALEATIGVAG